MSRDRLGRIIGAAGAACGSLFWCVALYAVAGLLMEPNVASGIAVVVLMPMVIFASLLLVVSAADVVVLVRRVDVHMPMFVAFSHAVMAFGLLQFNKTKSLLPVAILVAIAISQLVAIYLFRQITPSHASSQR